MDSFSLYLQEGFLHITDLKGLDHILFIAAICLSLQFSDFKKIIFAVTSFTIGHSLSLALSIYDQILVPGKIIEWLIPVTIILSLLFNLKKENPKDQSILSKTIIIGLFGIIHGMGFSNFLKSMMGLEENILLPLLAFNTGLEIGQLLIVIFILFLNFTIVGLLKTNQRRWVLSGSAFILIISLWLCIERWPF